MTYRLYFLFATLFTLPFAIRKVLWADPAPYFKEYSDISIYLFEIFVIGYVLVSILEHKILIKSILKKVFHVEHFLLLILVSLSTLLAVFFQERYFSIYFLIRWVTYTLFGILLYKDLIQIVPRGTIDKDTLICSTWNIPLFSKILKLFHVEQSATSKVEIVPRGTFPSSKNCSTWNILRIILLLSLFLQSVVIFLQVFWQRSTGLFLLGETILDPAISGVSTIILSNGEFLRGYGTFLHPNIAAFFFFVYGISYILLSIVPRGTLFPSQNTSNCSTWNIKNIIKDLQLFHVEHSFPHKIPVIVPRGTILVILGLILLGFFLTFSKSVLLVAIITVFLWIFWINCSTWNIPLPKKYSKLFHVEQLFTSNKKIVPRGTILILGIVLLGMTTLALSRVDFIRQSILERKLQYLSIPVSNPVELLAGQGLGSYVEMLEKKSPGLFSWQFQPIHNTYILVLFELGLLPILGIALYYWGKWKKYTAVQGRTAYSLSQKAVFIIGGGVALLLAVDHYMWDIEQGQSLFVLLATILIFVFHYPIPKNSK